MKLIGLSGFLLNDVINKDFDFYGYKTFHGGIGVSSSLDLSGNFYVNNGVDRWNAYRV